MFIIKATYIIAAPVIFGMRIGYFWLVFVASLQNTFCQHLTAFPIISTGYRLYEWGNGARFPAGAIHFSHLHSIHTRPLDTEGSSRREADQLSSRRPTLRMYEAVPSLSLFMACILIGPADGLVVRVPGYRTEMYCASCEVRTEFMYVM
jgi:hypothetical protein